LVRQTFEQLEVEILKGVVSKEHVYLFVSAQPIVSASNIMKHVKGISSIEKAILESIFLGTRLFLCNGR